MKKSILLPAFAIIFAFFSPCSAQFQVVYNCGLGDTCGGFQQSAVLIIGKTIYSTSSVGGHDSGGSLFTVDTNGNNFKTLVSYTYHAIYGTPAGWLISLNGNVYGIISGNGTGIGSHDSGAIFSYNTNTNAYKEIYGFDTWSGTDNANIIFIGNKIYGANSYSGLYGEGTIFSVDTDGSNYRVLYNYNSTGGDVPNGIVLYGNKFYGTTGAGGLNGDGTIYSVDTNGTGFLDLVDFQGANGSSPNMVNVFNGKIFGSTTTGGAYDSGVIFSVDTNGLNFKILYNFNNATGAGPASNMILTGNLLTGVTYQGAKFNNGNLFSADTGGLSLTDLADFDSANGEYPESYLTYDTNAGEIYGEALFGGPYDGLIFRYKFNTTGINQLPVISGQLSVEPNPSNGIFTFQSSLVSRQWSVEVFDVLGEKVYSSPITPHSSLMVDMRSQPNGIYFYRAKNEAGELTGSGKIIVSK